MYIYMLFVPSQSIYTHMYTYTLIQTYYDVHTIIILFSRWETGDTKGTQLISGKVRNWNRLRTWMGSKEVENRSVDNSFRQYGCNFLGELCLPGMIAHQVQAIWGLLSKWLTETQEKTNGLWNNFFLNTVCSSSSGNNIKKLSLQCTIALSFDNNPLFIVCH